MEKLPDHIEKFCEQGNLDKVMIGVLYKSCPIAIEMMCVQNYKLPDKYPFTKDKE